MMSDDLKYAKLRDRLREAREQIGKAAILSGRKPEEVFLVAAVKTQKSSVIGETVKTGLIDFAGENRVQEYTEHEKAGIYSGFPVHFIGHLQTNKIKYLLGKVSLIQSVDSLYLAAHISKQAEKLKITQDILLEINVASETSKSGFDGPEIFEALPQMAGLKNIRIRGLLAIPPRQELKGQSTPYFERMNQLFIDIKAKKYDNVVMDYLSMGMSGDFFDAILCGSNMVRLGTFLFGKREA